MYFKCMNYVWAKFNKTRSGLIHWKAPDISDGRHRIPIEMGEIHYVHQWGNLRWSGDKVCPYLSIDSMQSKPNPNRLFFNRNLKHGCQNFYGSAKVFRKAKQFWNKEDCSYEALLWSKKNRKHCVTLAWRQTDGQRRTRLSTHE